MVERPIFIPQVGSRQLVKELYVSFKWNSGFAPVQKRKNVAALHAAAERAAYSPLLEISSKSEEKLGQHLSAFHLKVDRPYSVPISLESAFQGSKVFERGGPFTDLYLLEARDAKRDPRLQESGKLTGFFFDNVKFPLEPKTVFYDWLYVNAIFPHRAWLERLKKYAGFTDIEFNPSRSINCQARSCALFVALMKDGLLDEAIRSPSYFGELLSQFDYRPNLKTSHTQEDLQLAVN